MKLSKIQLILAICCSLVVVVPSGYYGAVGVSEVLADISKNTRHRLTLILEEKETRLWHLEHDFPAGASYPPGHVQKIIRLHNEIDGLEVQLGYKGD